MTQPLKRIDLEDWIRDILDMRYPQQMATYNRFTAADIVTMLVDRQVIPEPSSARPWLDYDDEDVSA